ncbi:MAG: GerAB/ArcD/ProY family transporter [Clostridia bacterium]|nr:GerAB/ArcD/ProY family transporter [Clostridia bacterium]
MNEQKLNYLQASFLVIIVTVTHLVLNLPNALISSTGSASIINVIYISILSIIMFLLVKKLLTPFESNNILYVAEYIGGKALKKFLALLYIFHFIFITGILLRSFAETLIFIYFPQSSTWTVLLSFLLVAIIANKIGAINIIKANAILMVPILSAIIITAISLVGKFEINRLFPIMGYGFKETFINGTTNIYAFSGVVYIYFLKPYLNNYKDFSKVGFISIAISSIYLLLTVSALLMMFPFLTADNQAMSVYLSTRIIEYGKFMQRTDAIYMFVWIFIFFSYLSVILVYISQISKESLQINISSFFIYLISFFIFIVSIIPKNSTQIRFLETTIYKYSSLGIVFILSLIILLLGYLKKRREKSINLRKKVRL